MGIGTLRLRQSLEANSGGQRKSHCVGGRDKTQNRDFSRMGRKASIEEGLALLAVELLATSRQPNGVVSGKNGHVLDRRRPRNGVHFAETAVVIRYLNYVSF